MKLTKLDKSFTKLSDPQEWHTVAARPRDYYTEETNIAGEGAIEAPFIIKRDRF